MKEAGMSSGADRIQVEHTIVVKLDESVEKLVNRVVDFWLSVAETTMQSANILALASAAALLLFGASTAYRALKSDKRPPYDL